MLARIINRHSRLRTRLVVIMVITVILPLLVIAPVILYRVKGKMTELVIETKAVNVSQIANSLGLTLSKLLSVSNMFSIDTELQTALQNAAAGAPVDRPYMNALFDKYNIAVPSISFQSIVIDAGGHVYGNAAYAGNLSVDTIRNREWYARLESYPHDIAWTMDTQLDKAFSTPELPYVYVIRNLYDLESWTKLGIMIIGFSENNLLFTYSSSAEEYENIYLVDAGGTVISSVNNLALPAGYALPWERMYSYEKGRISDMIGNNEYMIHYTTLRSPLWKVALMTSMRVPLNSANEIQEFFVLLILLYIVIVFAASYFVANAFLKPIHALSRNMSRIKKGDFDVSVDVRSNDEMADLSASFNDMARKIKTLLDDIVKDQESKRKMELTALQTQVNPHFIYNTLASIRFRASIDDKESVDRIILSLIKLLKNTLSDLDEFITVEKELDILKAYIEIQQMACEYPFESNLAVDGDIRNCLLPKLILQPIVENAILHGIKPRKKDGLLQIDGRRKDDTIEFTISDNGVGFEKDLIDLARSDVDFGIGIKNVEGRLKLHFADNYRFAIDSEKGQGTSVTVSIPYTIRDKGIIQYEYTDH